jgi:hypothetical protein
MKKLFSSKKGNKSVKMIMNALQAVIIAGFIMLAFVVIGGQYATGEMFNKLYVVKDLSLLIDSMYSVPYDVDFDYKEDTDKWIIEIEDGIVSIDKNTPVEASYKYAKSQDTISDIVTYDSKFDIMKRDNKILVAQDYFEPIKKISCIIQDFKINKLLIITTDFYDLKIADVYTDISENYYTNEIGNELESYLNYNFESLIVDVKSIDYIEYDLNDFKIDVSNYDYVFVLNFNENEKREVNPAFVYVNDYKDSKNLACYMLEGLEKQKTNLNEFDVFLVEGKMLENDLKKNVLSYGKNVLFFEIGNIYAKDSEHMIYNPYDVAYGLYNGLVEALRIKKQND